VPLGCHCLYDSAPTLDRWITHLAAVFPLNDDGFLFLGGVALSTAGTKRRAPTSQNPNIHGAVYFEPFVFITSSIVIGTIALPPHCEIELILMTALAIMGLSYLPNEGYKIPASTGAPRN
jgi:hypothetical protein